MTKTILPFFALFLISTQSIQAQTPQSTAEKPVKADFCTDFKKILAEALSNFDSLKGDTIRANKSIIIATKLPMPDMSMSRISVDKGSKQSFYRSFYDGHGNINTVKQKFEGLVGKIKACINDSTWVEDNNETESDTDYNRLYTLLQNPQDDTTKEYHGLVLDLEVEFNKTSDTEFSIMFTLSNYK